MSIPEKVVIPLLVPDRKFIGTAWLSNRKVYIDLTIHDLSEQVLFSVYNGLLVGVNPFDTAVTLQTEMDQNGLEIGCTEFAPNLFAYFTADGGLVIGSSAGMKDQKLFDVLDGLELGSSDMSLSYLAFLEVSTGFEVDSQLSDTMITVPVSVLPSGMEIGNSQVETPIIGYLAVDSGIVFGMTAADSVEFGLEPDANGIEVGASQVIELVVYALLSDHDDKILAEMDGIALFDLDIIDL